MNFDSAFSDDQIKFLQYMIRYSPCTRSQIFKDLELTESRMEQFMSKLEHNEVAYFYVEDDGTIGICDWSLEI